jgi:hypothetical protein
MTKDGDDLETLRVECGAAMRRWFVLAYFLADLLSPRSCLTQT